jgi:hypothetical protein
MKVNADALSISLCSWPEMLYINTKGKNCTIRGFGPDFEKKYEFFSWYWIIVQKVVY